MNNIITFIPCKECGVKIDVLTGYNGLCYKYAKKEKYDKMNMKEHIRGN